MTKTEMEKRFKRRKNVEQTAFNWAIAFTLLTIILLIQGDEMISLQGLAALAFTLLIFGWVIGLVHDILKKLELRKYDTGTLASIETKL